VGWALAILRVALSEGAPKHLKTAWLFCILGLTFTLCTVHVWTAIYSYCFFLLGAGQWMANTSNKLYQPKRPTLQSVGFTRAFQPQFRREVTQ